jgi:uncharacterized protein YndB with AHSA1/START domain
MPDILQDLPIDSPPTLVYAGISEPALLDRWWTKQARGRAVMGAIYELDFGPGFQWRAEVTRAEPGVAFELRMLESDRDWIGTRVGFELSPTPSGTQLRFSHRDWPAANEHFRTSCHCWALYLRVLRRFLEQGEVVPYERRLSA